MIGGKPFKNLAGNCGGIQGHSQGDIFPLVISVKGGTIGYNGQNIPAPGTVELHDGAGVGIHSMEFEGTDSPSFRIAQSYIEAMAWEYRNGTV